MGDVADIDWNDLRKRAFAAMRHAYAPYSGFAVGAAGLTEDGRVVVGCNVENVSLGLTVCAENVLVGNLFSSGGGRLRAVACAGPDGAAVMPCGRCRQVLLEHGGTGLTVDAGLDAPVTLGELLPRAFGPGEVDSGAVRRWTR
ncbi:cytidine deaminase [Tomitella fengzijianii]|uniref:Cytidine deaminase n=1 Tax=Tomitella fengzijianii TaxID=2597660 RepID=A0A516X0Y8_9ACTN|nr:cytidine deaminase [Tomitella fengzijianii]QDQ96754.1 cytidine deaminase [Tomitella fengzijianii]